MRGKPKTRGCNTMTESAFWSMIRSALRQKSRWWPPVKLAKQRARRIYHGLNKRQKYEYQCNDCKRWFIEKDISVDHIIPCGSLTCADDLPVFVEKMFCEVEGLQVLCGDCHSKKTANERNN